MSSSIAVFTQLRDLDIDFSEIEQQLTKKVVTEIQNAIENGSNSHCGNFERAY